MFNPGAQPTITKGKDTEAQSSGSGLYNWLARNTDYNLSNPKARSESPGIYPKERKDFND